MSESAADSRRTAASPGEALGYASPYHAAPSYWGAGILALVGLGLIGLGGCFLIGVLAVHSPQVFLPNATPTPLTWGSILFVIILYALAGLCFVNAGLILWRLCARLFKHL